MTRKQRFEFVIDYFQTFRPEAETELTFGNTYELLVAVILSGTVIALEPSFRKRFLNLGEE